MTTGPSRHWNVKSAGGVVTQNEAACVVNLLLRRVSKVQKSFLIIE